MKEQVFNRKYIKVRYCVSTSCFPGVDTSTLRPLLMAFIKRNLFIMLALLLLFLLPP